VETEAGGGGGGDLGQPAARHSSEIEKILNLAKRTVDFHIDMRESRGRDTRVEAGSRRQTVRMIEREAD